MLTQILRLVERDMAAIKTWAETHITDVDQARATCNARDKPIATSSTTR